MSAFEAVEKENVSFFKNLVNRRVPQIMGIYIGVGWGIVQFMEWIVNRYMLSPHLIDFTLVILLSLIPSSCIVAYYHGMPGRNKWVKAERVGIPLNVVVTAVIIIMLFQGKDLGSVSQTVTLQDETGKKIEREIPKSRYRKKIALFYFKNETGDSSLDWMQTGISYMLEFDLTQDLFIELLTPHVFGIKLFDFYIYEKIKNAGFKAGVGLPLTLKVNIAREYHMDYILFGKISKEEDEFILESSLYFSHNAKLAAKNTIRGKNIFKLIDDLSIGLKEDLEIPGGHIDAVGDLPVAEMFTGSLPAARFYTLAQNAMVFDKDWAKMQQYLELAIREDPTFAQAHNLLVAACTLTNQSEKLPGVFQPLMKHIYKLPERDQLYVKFSYYSAVKQDLEKGLAVLRMIVKLYPEDLRAHLISALLLKAKHRFDEAVSSYKRVLEIDPRRYDVFREIGEIYELKNDLSKALEYYKKYAEHFPKNPESFTIIGKLNREAGNLEQAKEYYEKALLLEPENISALAVLARIEEDLGHFDKAVKQFEEALPLAGTAKKKYDLYDELGDFYERRGRMKKALECRRLLIKAMEEFSVPVYVSIVKAFSIKYYIRAGKEKEAFRLLDALKSELRPPYDRYITAGYLSAYLELKKRDEAEKKIAEVQDFVTATADESLRRFLFSARGKFFEMRGEYADAVKNYDARLKITPTDTTSLRQIGRCYRHLKQYEKAEEYIRKVLKLYPYDPKSNYELALVYLDKGNKEKAAEHLKIAVDVWKDADPGYEPARSAKEKLAQFTAVAGLN